MSQPKNHRILINAYKNSPTYKKKPYKKYVFIIYSDFFQEPKNMAKQLHTFKHSLKQKINQLQKKFTVI